MTNDQLKDYIKETVCHRLDDMNKQIKKLTESIYGNGQEGLKTEISVIKVHQNELKKDLREISKETEQNTDFRKTMKTIKCVLWVVGSVVGYLVAETHFFN